jgi:hypothetical protein
VNLSQFVENGAVTSDYSTSGNIEFQQQQTYKLLVDCANKRDFEKLDVLLLDPEFKKTHGYALKKLLEDAASKKDHALFGFLNIRGVYSIKAYFSLLIQSVIARIPGKLAFREYEPLPVL